MASRTAFVGLLIVGLASMHSTGAAETRSLSLEERIAAQRAIEQVYWNHRNWPQENPGLKPPLSAVLPDDALRAKVEDTLRKSNALEKYWHRPITAEQLQAEMNRMAAHTRDPRVLRELFAALGNNPFLIAETLARQSLADRLIHDWYSSDERFHGDLRMKAEAALATCPDIGCMKSLGGEYRETTWRLDGEEAGAAPADARRDVVTLQPEEWKAHLVGLATAVGGVPDSLPLRKVGVLEVTPDAFVVTAVQSRGKHEVRTAAVAWRKSSFDDWWETERPTLAAAIQEGANLLTLPTTPSSGCAADTWEPTGVPSSVPLARDGHIAVWTGAEMIVWGGDYNTGGRYDPSTDTWTPTSTGANTPMSVGGESAGQTAVWTGTEMIVWGGGQDDVYCDCSDIVCTCGEPIPFLNPGGRYNPLVDTWAVVGGDILASRYFHSAIWTGTEMIVWGGEHVGCTHLNGCFGCGSYCEQSPLATGGRYNPSTDTWTPTPTGANVPDARIFHTAVWTGTEMIVWGGIWQGNRNTGGRYEPSTDTWTPTSTGANVPDARNRHTAVWTGTEMIVWGGEHQAVVNTGGRYHPSTDTWMPTSTGAHVPAGRYEHSAVWTGTEMIVWAGYYYGSNPSGYLNTGGRYDPSADTWIPTSTGPSVPSERLGHTAVWTGTQMVVWGGNNGAVNLNDGGLYCACPNGTLSYRDADADGYGDAAVVGPSCDGTIPVGYVANHADCNDTSASVHPGALELCNAVDDDCDGTVDYPAPPGPVTSLTLRRGAPEIGWSPFTEAQTYDVVVGDLVSLRSSGGNFTTSTLGCLAPGTAETSVDFANTPEPGQAFWVLFRGDNCVGTGTYDSDDPGQVGSRDAEIGVSPLSCGYQAVCGDGACTGGENCGGCPADCGTCGCTADAECQPASCCQPMSCITIWEPQSCGGGTCSDGCWFCLSACLCQAGQCVAIF